MTDSEMAVVQAIQAARQDATALLEDADALEVRLSEEAKALLPVKASAVVKAIPKPKMPVIPAKRDQGCLWARGVTPKLAEAIRAAEAGDKVNCLVNGVLTQFTKMATGKDGRKTEGLRIVKEAPGYAEWNAIQMGEAIEIEASIPTDGA